MSSVDKMGNGEANPDTSKILCRSEMSDRENYKEPQWLGRKVHIAWWGKREPLKIRERREGYEEERLELSLVN